MEWLQHSFQKYPELAIFLTLASGFFVGKIKIGKFSAGFRRRHLVDGGYLQGKCITIAFIQEIKARNKSNHVARQVDSLEMWELISNIPVSKHKPILRA